MWVAINPRVGGPYFLFGASISHDGGLRDAPDKCVIFFYECVLRCFFIDFDYVQNDLFVLGLWFSAHHVLIVECLGLCDAVALWCTVGGVLFRGTPPGALCAKSL